MLFQTNKAVKSSIPVKRQLYTTIIRPIVTYGVDTWAIRKIDENRHFVLEKKILRRIFGLLKNSITNVWMIRKKGIRITIYIKNQTSLK